MTTACRSLYANARVYDADIGRLLSADTLIPSPYHSQSYNRYSYLNNNPLGDTDSTGNAPDGQTAEEFLQEVNDYDDTIDYDLSGTTYSHKTKRSISSDGTRNTDLESTINLSSGDKLKVSVHNSKGINFSTTQASTLLMLKDGAKIPLGIMSGTFARIGNGKTANGANSASFANLFSQYKSATRELAYRVNKLQRDIRQARASTNLNPLPKGGIVSLDEFMIPAPPIIAAKLGVLVGAIGKVAGKASINLPKIIHFGAQGKHIIGHNNFIKGRSILTEDAEKLLNQVHAGEVNIIRTTSRGVPVVDFKKSIGIYYENGKKIGSTSYGKIHTNKHGAHIVPAHPGGNL